MKLRDKIKQRVIQEALFYVGESSTIRETAKKLGVSKSTVHNDFRKKLENIDKELYKKVLRLIQINTEERALRGGVALRNKRKKGDQN